MSRRTIAWLVFAFVASAAGATMTPLVRAADQNVMLFASNTRWHVGSDTAPENPTITVLVNDTLRLTIRNSDMNDDHTFTAPQFGVDRPLARGATIFVNITPTTTNVGRWQFHCAIPGHTSGSAPTLSGMVGTIEVVTPSQPLNLVVIGVIVVVIVAVVAAAAIAMRRRRKAS